MDTIGIIGAGAAGLCAAKHVLATKKYKPILWELAPELGGTWRYSLKTGIDGNDLPIHSSMYKSLKTNLPKEVMAFPDFPFPEYEDSFLHHTKVLKYLQDYADHFQLKPWIKYEHFVKKVEPIPQKSGPPSWAITVKDLKTGTASQTICQAVIVCVGHYSVPRHPKLPGIKDFRGRQMHSHDYREPSPFKGATVIVLGAGPSGMDIAIEISEVAEEVLLSHNSKPIHSALPSNLKQVKGAVSATHEGFRLADGTFIKADYILYCTGYESSFPFLDDKCNIRVDNRQVKHLFKHLINIAHPSMALLGVPFKICPFPSFDVQARYFLKVISGELKLPSTNDMEKEVQDEYEAKRREGIADKYFHDMETTQWKYFEDLAALSGSDTLPPVIKTLFNDVRAMRAHSLMTYKETTYMITGPETYECVQEAYKPSVR